MKGQVINSMKEKKASPDRDKHTIQRMAFKGTGTFFALKEYLNKKNKAKRSCTNSPEFSFQSGSENPRITGIKQGDIGKKGLKTM